MALYETLTTVCVVVELISLISLEKTLMIGTISQEISQNPKIVP